MTIRNHNKTDFFIWLRLKSVFVFVWRFLEQQTTFVKRSRKKVRWTNKCTNKQNSFCQTSITNISRHTCAFLQEKKKTENFQSSKQEDATKNAISGTHFICFLKIFKNFFQIWKLKFYLQQLNSRKKESYNSLFCIYIWPVDDKYERSESSDR